MTSAAAQRRERLLPMAIGFRGDRDRAAELAGRIEDRHELASRSCCSQQDTLAFRSQQEIIIGIRIAAVEAFRRGCTIGARCTFTWREFRRGLSFSESSGMFDEFGRYRALLEFPVPLPNGDFDAHNCHHAARGRTAGNAFQRFKAANPLSTKVAGQKSDPLHHRSAQVDGLLWNRACNDRRVKARDRCYLYRSFMLQESPASDRGRPWRHLTHPDGSPPVFPLKG